VAAAAVRNAVEKGDLLLLLEAMKMDICIIVQLTGVIPHLRVAPGGQMEPDQSLAEMEPTSDV